MIKNHLPAELGAAMKTKNQWEKLRFILKPNAKPYKMHPSVMSHKTFNYYHIDDVVVDKGWEFQERQERLAVDLKEATGHGGLSNLKRRRTKKGY